MPVSAFGRRAGQIYSLLPNDAGDLDAGRLLRLVALYEALAARPAAEGRFDPADGPMGAIGDLWERLKAAAR